MTREEFVVAMNYIAAGSGKALCAESLEVYFDLLRDLSASAMMVAAKRVLLTHRFATFPTIAELREASVQTIHGAVSALSAAEAWQLAWSCVGETDPEREGSYARASAKLPPLVKRAIEAFGLSALCYGREPVAVVRAQFLKIYEQLAARERQAELLPASVRRSIEVVGMLSDSKLPAIATESVTTEDRAIRELSDAEWFRRKSNTNARE